LRRDWFTFHRYERHPMRINLGDKAACTITGFTGICVARTEWISGCTRVTLQPAVDKDGKVPDGQTFDEPMLKVVKAGAIALGPKDTGGPRPAPTRQATPAR
jgi:hypothetical protein